ncbi:MAG: hypothetical protein AB7R55_16390 [Gemmatimonadales bacterium]
MRVVEQLLEPIEADLPEERPPDLGRPEVGQIEQRSGESVVLLPRLIERRHGASERVDAGPDPTLDPFDLPDQAVDRRDRAAGRLSEGAGLKQVQALQVGLADPAGQRLGRVDRRLRIEARGQGARRSHQRVARLRQRPGSAHGLE